MDRTSTRSIRVAGGLIIAILRWSLLAFFDPNDSGYESRTGVGDFTCNLPASLSWEDQRSGLKSCIAVAVWNACTQRWCWCIEPPAVYLKFALESFSSGPPELHA
jgi:hypothetical protein